MINQRGERDHDADESRNGEPAKAAFELNQENSWALHRKMTDGSSTVARRSNNGSLPGPDQIKERELAAD